MQNYCKTIGALAAASALVAGNASAEVQYQIHTGYSTEYLFRGLDTGDNLAEAGLDAAASLNGIGLSAGAWWGSFNNGGGGFTGNDRDNELDLYGEVSKDFGFVTGAIGYIYYWNMGNLGADNQEVYFKASRDLGFAKASLTYFWDVDDDNGGDTNGYTELALSKSWDLGSCLTLNVGTNVGFLMDDGNFTAWTTKASLDWGFVEHAKLSPFVALSIALDETKNTSWFETGNEFTAGTMLSVSF